MSFLAKSAVQRETQAVELPQRATLRNRLVVLVAFAGAAFHIYTGATAPLPAMQQRVVHLTFGLVLTFLAFRATKHPEGSRGRGVFAGVDILLALVSLGSGLYLLLNANNLLVQLSPTGFDIVIAFVLTAVVLEATRRTTGMVLPVIAIIAIIYALFGQNLPGLLQHSGSSVGQIARYLSLSTEGIFGIALGVSATYVILFVLFGSLLQLCGAGELMLKIAETSVGRYRGGAAKGATIASGLFGSISGSPVGNVAATGPVTIPMMISTGFKPKTAAAIEATASTGGMIMPPVMGATAFLVAEILAIPYTTVVIAALIPAILYYVAILVTIDFHAAKHGLRGTKVERALYAFWVLIFKRGYQLIPLAVLIYMLAVEGTTASRAAYWGLVIAAIIALGAAIVKRKFKSFPMDLVQTLAESFKSMVVIIMACATAGIVMGMMAVTGLGFRLSYILTEVAGSSLVLLLLLTMVASIILGMSLPAVAAYLVLAVTVAPALIELGVVPLAAHLFVFYFGVLSNITPPVALAAFTAAGIAKASPHKTGLEAVKFALSGFVIPFVIVFSPALIFDGTPTEIIIATGTTLFGIIALSAAVTGYFGRIIGVIPRIILLIASVALIAPYLWSGLIGLAIMVILYVINIVVTKGQTKNEIQPV